MNHVPNPPGDAPDLPLETPAQALVREYGDRWQIDRVSIEVWTAVHRSPDRRHIRVLVGTPEELRSKLQTAEVVEPD